MNFFRPGQLVTVTGDDGTVDGIVFEALSAAKSIVAVPDSEHGAVFQTVASKALTARESQGADDKALRDLIRRTPASGRGLGSGTNLRGHSGHTGARMHRPTGR